MRYTYQFSSVTQSYPNLWDPVDCSTPGFLSITNSQSLLKLISIKLMMPSNHLILCHPTISSSVIPFSSCLQSFPASGPFPMSQFFPSGGQSVRVSASASVLPMNIQDWSPLGWTGWISLQSRDSQESSPTPQFKSINSSVLSFLYGPTLTSIHDHRENHSFDYTGLWRQCLYFLTGLRP